MTNTIKGNKIIADFMEYKKEGLFYDIDVFNLITGNLRKHHEEQLCFEISWDWLMPVVDKIESIGETEFYKTRIEINSHCCSINSILDNCPSIIIGSYLDSPEKKKESTKIKAAWRVCIEFIKWYNKQINKIET
jgi:hypothetical protein